MTMNRSGRLPGVPTLPKGEQVAAYPTYLEAQRAVDHLSDQAFPVQAVTIVGTDLRMVERVTGRLTYPRVALAGLASGAWFGLFVGLLLSFFGGGDGASLPILPAVAIGAGFGMLFAVISHAFTGGKRDFTSASQIVAASYALLCDGAEAHRARSLLAQLGAGRPTGAPATGTVSPASTTPPNAVPPSATPPDATPPSAPPTAPGAHAAGPSSAPLPPSDTPAPHGDPGRGVVDDHPRG
jgi:hypothetical protein